MPRRHRLGWALFLLSAALFVAAGIRNGEPFVVIASVVFGAACVLFLLDR